MGDGTSKTDGGSAADSGGAAESGDRSDGRSDGRSGGRGGSGRRSGSDRRGGSDSSGGSAGGRGRGGGGLMRVARVGARGALAGVGATAAMSVVFVAADRAGAIDRPPPRSIIDHFLPWVPPKPSDRVAVATHFAYGAAGGVAFEALTARTHGLGRRLAYGAAFGLAVWAAGYEGWVPAMHVLPPAHRDHPARVATELAAHLVYGLSLGAASHRTSRTVRRAELAGSVEA